MIKAKTLIEDLLGELNLPASDEEKDLLEKEFNTRIGQIIVNILVTNLNTEGKSKFLEALKNGQIESEAEKLAGSVPGLLDEIETAVEEELSAIRLLYTKSKSA